MEKLGFDYSKLRGRIVEKFGTQGNFADAMEWSERTMSLKMSGKVPWGQPDIVKATELLGLEYEDISTYFFTPSVKNFEHKGGEEI